jgi:hypothetical protein
MSQKNGAKPWPLSSKRVPRRHSSHASTLNFKLETSNLFWLNRQKPAPSFVSGARASRPNQFICGENRKMTADFTDHTDENQKSRRQLLMKYVVNMPFRVVRH